LKDFGHSANYSGSGAEGDAVGGSTKFGT